MEQSKFILKLLKKYTFSFWKILKIGIFPGKLSGEFKSRPGLVQNADEWIVTDGEMPQQCQKCGAKELNQDQDVFDTWFSSGQWPYAILKTTNALEVLSDYSHGNRL